MSPAARVALGSAPAWLAMLLATVSCRPQQSAESPAAPASASSATGAASETEAGPAKPMKPGRLDAQQRAALDRLAARADDPGDFDSLRDSGLAHMWFALSGYRELQIRAETDLEKAFALRPDDDEVARSLGRFYNMRAVAGDDSKADRQAEVFAAFLGGAQVDAMDTRTFSAYAFAQLGELLTLKNRGNVLKALSKINDLEAELARRTAADPKDIELWAMAGNFAFFFAGNVPFDRQRRVSDAVRYFEHVRVHWSDIRPAAGSTAHCPNTRENFMFELAEGYLVLERSDEARAIYEELSDVQPPATAPKQQIAAVSRERLANLDRYAGEMRLMPPWPSDVANCQVCHAYAQAVSDDTLYSLEPIEWPDEGEATPRRPHP